MLCWDFMLDKSGMRSVHQREEMISNAITLVFNKCSGRKYNTSR